MSTFVIAEVGSTHDGQYDRATDLIRAVRDSGANACKFQYWSSAARLAERRHAPTYKAIYERYAMPYEWLPKLWAECERAGLEFMCTAYLPEDIGVVAAYVKRFKIASFEASDEPFVRAHLPYRKPILASTGLTSTPPSDSVPDVWWLHCVSAYPTPLNEANLGVLRVPHYGYRGLSDHTCCIHTGGFAVAAGAEVLEVHVRNWTTPRDNPDYTTALDPGQFTEYVRLVRLAERMLGDGIKRVMPSEAPMLPYLVGTA